MPRNERRKSNLTFAYALALIAGLLILFGGLFSLAFGAFTTRFSMMSNYMTGGYGMMRGSYGYGMMSGFGTGLLGYLALFPLIGIVSGAMIVYSAFMLHSRPKDAHTFGTVIIVFSIISFFGSGGFLGALLGVLAGIIALSEKK